MRRNHESGSRFDTSLYTYAGEELHAHWATLHKGDREPFPSAQRITRLARGNARLTREVQRAGGADELAAALQEAWRAFHAGAFDRAIENGAKLGVAGASVANKAAAILSLYLEKDERKRLAVLRTAIERGDEASECLTEDANVAYTLALVLGRYSQRISILQAIAEGHASRIRQLLERALELEPRHAEAHIALGLFHAELVKTLGGLAASLTYGASGRQAVGHFERALKLVPSSPIAHVEYAHGLLLLDASTNRQQVEKLCGKAAAFKPHDAMEHFDVQRAKTDCARA